MDERMNELRKEFYGAGDLEKEMEIIREQVNAPDITPQTALFTIFCC